MNAFYLVGKVLEKPEVLTTNNGIKYAHLKLSVLKNSKDDDETYEIFEVTLFRNLASDEYDINQLVAIQGRLQANNYEKEENIYYNSKLIANTITILE